MFTKIFLIKLGIILLFKFFYIIAAQNVEDVCTTVRNQPGQCIFLTNCAVYYDIIKNQVISPDQRKMIADSLCGTVNGNHKVCCPTSTPGQKKTLQPVSNVNLDMSEISIEPILEYKDYSNHPNAQLLEHKNCNAIQKGGPELAYAKETEVFDYPFMAIIQYQSVGAEIKQICGGTVISKRYVLTAAHCTIQDHDRYSVVVGEHNTQTEFDCLKFSPTVCADPIQTIQVERIIAHPLYNRRNLINDIALIRLKNDIEFSSVRPICLPVSIEKQQTPLHFVHVTGWGLTENNTVSSSLLHAQLEVINNTACGAIYKEKTGFNIIATHLCAGIGESDSCQGDSGGPAFDKANKYTQYGVVSAGISTCGVNPGLPSLYTRIVPYMKWILDNMMA